MSTKIATYDKNGQPHLRPEFGMHESTHSRVTVTYKTMESANEVIHRFTTSGNQLSDCCYIETVSVAEVKKVSWSRVREYKEMAREQKNVK